MAVTDYSATPSSNTSIAGINVGENCPRANINDAIRQLMADLKTLVGPNTGALTAIAGYAEASAAEYRAATASRALSAANVWTAAQLVTLTDAATIAVDMNTFLNATVTLGGNRTLGNPTNAKPGQSGFIRVVQDGTGSRTLALSSNWKTAGGAGLAALSTAAGSIDVLKYIVHTTTFIEVSLTKDVK